MPGLGATDTDSPMPHQRRNSSSLVCSSPPEVLQHIFRLYVTDLQEDYRPEHGLPPSAVLSHVCIRWREICLNYRSLWSCIPYMLRGKWPLEFVARSGDLPLDVSLWLGKDSGSSSMAQLIVPVVHRLRYLFVLGSLAAFQNLCDALTDQPAPLLEHLHFWRDAPRRSDIVPGIAVALPTNIFAHSSPRLRVIRLTHAQLAGVPVPAFAHATDITLGASTPADILQLLHSTPQLQSLECRDVSNLIRPGPISITDGNHVSALELTDLKLWKIKLGDVTTILDSLIAPSLERLVLNEMAVTRPDIPLYASTLPRALSPHIETIQQHRPPNEEVFIDTEMSAFWCWTRHKEHVKAKYLSPFYLSWRGNPWDDVDINQFVGSILGVLLVDKVRTVTLHETIIYRDRDWACLYALHNVTQLECKMETAEDLLDILQAMTPVQQHLSIGRMPPRDERTLFPMLDKLVIIDIRISTSDSVFLHVLQNLAESRKRDGKLLTIAFEDCNYSARVMLELKKEAHVTWNGAWCPPFAFGSVGEDPELENWEGWGSMFDQD